MTLHDDEIVRMIGELLDAHSVPVSNRGRYVRENRSAKFLQALAPLIDRYLLLVDSPVTCQVTHDHWEGPMICGNQLPCRTHGGR